MGQTAQSWHCMSTLCEYSFDKITSQAFFRGLTKYGPVHTFQHAQYKKNTWIENTKLRFDFVVDFGIPVL